MNVNTILVPTDFSPCSEAALDYATMLARDLGASLLITHILPTAEIPGAYDDIFDPRESSLHEKLNSLRPNNPRIQYEHCFGHGIPSHAILHIAEHKGADMIVMGAHGETDNKVVPLGEVAKHVLLESPCPVLIFSTAHTVTSTSSPTS